MALSSHKMDARRTQYACQASVYSSPAEGWRPGWRDVMRIGIIGAGHIGGNAADLWVKAGHEVMLSFSRDTRRLEALAAQLGPRASVGTPAEAASFGEVVMLSVPWRTIGDAL